MEKKARTKGIPWVAIQDAATAECLTIQELAARFNVGEGTIRKRVDRGKLTIIAKLIGAVQQRAAEKAAEKVIEKKADEWLEKGENHRKVAFDVAHESLKLMKAKAPRNFREAELADKIARRAAGLDTQDVVSQTLININESMAADDEPTPVIEAVVVPAPSVPELSNGTTESSEAQTPSTTGV
jgi:peptidyl-tRNA hydrolase